MACNRCVAAGVRCEYRQFDLKRTPVSREYVAVLESRIASLESMLESQTMQWPRHHDAEEQFWRDVNYMKISNSAPITPLFESSILDEHCTTWSNSVHADPGVPLLRSSPGIMNLSIMQATADVIVDKAAGDPLSLINLSQNGVFMECVRSFFRSHNPWLSFFDEPNFMEKLTSFSPTHGWISSVYAVAATGALTAQSAEARIMSAYYIAMCEEKLSLQFVKSSENTVDALLLCAIYYCGQVDSAKAQRYQGKTILS